ncbi:MULTISPECIES: CHAT domain-containing protein [Sphingomonadaceae]|uniref:CHAT domain-containing protein n=1 Tax=Blastomonas fulva TaxID=1550728 RepID=UPI004033F296
MILSAESIASLRARALTAIDAAHAGRGDPQVAAVLWRQVVDSETDPYRRAKELLNLASALDLTDDAGRIQAVAITDRAIKTLRPKDVEAASCYVMAAQRLVRSDNLSDAATQRKALDYLHAGLAVPMTAAGRETLVALIRLYSQVACLVGDFSRIKRARHIAERLAHYGFQKDELWTVYAAIIQLHETRWKAQSHRPSLGRAIQLAREAIAKYTATTTGEEVMKLAALQQQHAILLLDRYALERDEADIEAAITYLRLSSAVEQGRSEVLNSLALALMASDDQSATDAQFREAKQLLLEGLDLSRSATSTAHLNWSFANWHLEAYRRGGPVSHIDSAIEAAESAANLISEQNNRIHFTVADAYCERFRVAELSTDIDRAIEAAECGISLCPVTSSERWQQEITTANLYQERAVKGQRAFDLDDAVRASTLYTNALDRIPGDSPLRIDTAATALGAMVENFAVTSNPLFLKAARAVAQMLPRTTSDAERLSPVVASNLACFKLIDSPDEASRRSWSGLLRQIAMQHGESETGWLAASNLMHRNVDHDWGLVVEAFQIIARQRASRLAATRTARERVMTLRREQNAAALAGLALVHLDRAADAARLIDEAQAALLIKSDSDRVCFAPDDAIWSSIDAIFYPAVTRYGGYAIVATRDGCIGVRCPEISSIVLPKEPGVPSPSTLAVAASLLDAAFPSGPPPRLLIVPAGRLGLIPWPAVQIGLQCLADQSTITVLPTRALWRPGSRAQYTHLVTIEAASVAGEAALRHADAEVGQLRFWMPDGVDLAGDELTPAAIAAALPYADIAHFACHGVIDPQDPTKTRLLLPHHAALTILDVVAIDCSGLSLAILSACRSAVHDVGLPDEFASMATAFLVAGARCAIGTLWNVNDVPASLFVRRLAWSLHQGRSPQAATRAAQLWLRDSSDDDKAVWLDRMGDAESEGEKWLRTQLRGHSDRWSFAAPKHWAAFTCYGLSEAP